MVISGAAMSTSSSFTMYWEWSSLTFGIITTLWKVTNWSLLSIAFLALPCYFRLCTDQPKYYWKLSSLEIFLQLSSRIVFSSRNSPSKIWNCGILSVLLIFSIPRKEILAYLCGPQSPYTHYSFSPAWQVLQGSIFSSSRHYFRASWSMMFTNEKDFFVVLPLYGHKSNLTDPPRCIFLLSSCIFLPILAEPHA